MPMAMVLMISVNVPTALTPVFSYRATLTEVRPLETAPCKFFTVVGLQPFDVPPAGQVRTISIDGNVVWSQNLTNNNYIELTAISPSICGTLAGRFWTLTLANGLGGTESISLSALDSGTNGFSFTGLGLLNPQ
jgi:hypothetical protein